MPAVYIFTAELNVYDFCGESGETIPPDLQGFTLMTWNNLMYIYRYT